MRLLPQLLSNLADSFLRLPAVTWMIWRQAVTAAGFQQCLRLTSHRLKRRQRHFLNRRAVVAAHQMTMHKTLFPLTRLKAMAAAYPTRRLSTPPFLRAFPCIH